VESHGEGKVLQALLAVAAIQSKLTDLEKLLGKMTEMHGIHTRGANSVILGLPGGDYNRPELDGVLRARRVDVEPSALHDVANLNQVHVTHT